MSKSKEAIQFDNRGASYAEYLNTDVELVVGSTAGKQVANMVEMVNQVNLDTDLIKGYCDEFASALVAQGIDKGSVKALKSARKCILDFALGVRTKQVRNAELWSNGEGKAMVVDTFKDAGSINQLAGKCREAEDDNDENAPDKAPWDLGLELQKFIDKAEGEGFSIADITKALKELTPKPAKAA